MRLILFLFLSVMGAAIVIWKRHVGAKQLQEVETGNRCTACNATNVTPEGRGIRCGQCGHWTDLAWLNNASVDQNEMNAIANPDEWM